MVLTIADSLTQIMSHHEDYGGHEYRSESDAAEEHLSPSLIGWRWSEVKNHLAVISFVLISGLAKLGFHRAHFLSSRVPESCLLIILGVFFGALIYAFTDDECSLNQECIDESQLIFPKFTPELFFFYLLPPIILEAAYCLHNKHFFDNIRAILLFAVVGTIINFLLIGGLLIFVQNLGWINSEQKSSSVEIFLFSSLISAVDPVAVLSIFAEVGVNADLYFLVFGESLLNDGVAVVLYNMMSVFAGRESKGMEVGYGHILMGIGSFLTVALGGLMIGIIFGLLTAVITRFTSGVRVVEPLALLGGAYLAYITTELFHWSGILSLIGCGITQAHYTFKNISQESLTTVNYFIKMLSSTSDCIIFLYLGMAFFQKHVWNTSFVGWTLLFCFIVRFITIYGLCFLVNLLRRNIKPICLKEQFIMAYGGLRGAVGFSLVTMISQAHVPDAQMFVTTTLAVVMFTVFLQGSTIKFIVNFLNINRKTDDNITLTEEINKKVFEHVMAGVEVISGKRGHFYAQNLFQHYDRKFFKTWFCVKDYDRNMKKIYEEISLGDHFLHLYGPSIISSKTINNNILKQDMEGIVNKGFDDHIVKFLDKENDLQRCSSLPLKQRLMDKSRHDTLRESLRKALKNDPVGKLHQVHDRDLVHGGESEIGHHLQKRRESARRIRRKILSSEGQEDRKQSTGSESSASQENLLPGDRAEVNILLEKHQELRRRKSTNGSVIREGRRRYLAHKNSITPSIREQDENCTDL